MTYRLKHSHNNNKKNFLQFHKFTNFHNFTNTNLPFPQIYKFPWAVSIPVTNYTWSRQKTFGARVHNKKGTRVHTFLVVSSDGGEQFPSTSPEGPAINREPTTHLPLRDAIYHLKLATYVYIFQIKLTI